MNGPFWRVCILFRSIMFGCLQERKSTATCTLLSVSGPMTAPRLSSLVLSKGSLVNLYILTVSLQKASGDFFFLLFPTCQHSQFKVHPDELNDERRKQQRHLCHHRLHASSWTMYALLPFPLIHHDTNRLKRVHYPVECLPCIFLIVLHPLCSQDMENAWSMAMCSTVGTRWCIHSQRSSQLSSWRKTRSSY